ncbi:hypothetical protein EG329_005037 [Mollisiaceae sp. DMI_Dod_QoI]|nr:hypothetical protein EG329_005037 [Helotiales sp. DMI_Dod_QoI]
MASSRPQSQRQKHILILGAGITGLSTAHALLTSHSTSKYKITIVATHTPGDFSPEYTSPWAGGHWRSHVGLLDADAEVRSWDERTYQAWTKLLEEGEDDGGLEGNGKGGVKESMRERERRIGLGFRTCHYFWGKEGEETRGGDGNGIWFRDVVREFGILNLELERKRSEDGEGDEKGMKVPEGAIMGMQYKSICFDPPRHLSYLFQRVQNLGARIIKTTLSTSSGLDGVVKDAKIILTKIGEGGEIFALINCCGLSSRHFLPLPESSLLYPIRGQTLLIKGEAKITTTFVGIPSKPDSEMLYVVPRPGSGTTVLGGCKQVGSWEESMDESLSARILEGVGRGGFCEELRSEKGEFEILSSQVGFRPGRKEGPRVEIERDERGRVKLVDGVRVVHSYGHAGAGYQDSVGCAEKVARLVAELSNSDP